MNADGTVDQEWLCEGALIIDASEKLVKSVLIDGLVAALIRNS